MGACYIVVQWLSSFSCNSFHLSSHLHNAVVLSRIGSLGVNLIDGWLILVHGKRLCRLYLSKFCSLEGMSGIMYLCSTRKKEIFNRPCQERSEFDIQSLHPGSSEPEKKRRGP